jgi:hypothetical protein
VLFDHLRRVSPIPTGRQAASQPARCFSH